MEAGLGDPDTRQHIGSFFERTPEERTGLARSNHQAQCCNFGPAAGQTVPHLHIHLIPRYAGDAEDPRGGVRWVMAGRARYW